MSIALPELDSPPAAFGDSCVVISFDAEIPCGAEAVITVVVGCVHEHLLHRPLCQHHVERLANGRVICAHCEDVDGHRCELHLLGEIPTSSS